MPGVEVRAAVEDHFGVGVGAEELDAEGRHGDVGGGHAAAEDFVEVGGGEGGAVGRGGVFGAVEAFDLDAGFDVLRWEVSVSRMGEVCWGWILLTSSVMKYQP